MPVDARKFSPGLFGAALLMFFFTFSTYSCMGTPLVKMSGVDMATGKNFELPKELRELAKSADTTTNAKSSDDQKIPGNKLALLALAATVVGLGVSLVKDNRTARIGGVAAGAIGALSLLIVKVGAESNLKKQAQSGGAGGGSSDLGAGVITVDFTLWFWLALLLLAAAAVINFLALRRNAAPGYAEGSTAPPYSSPPPTASYTPPAAAPYAPPEAQPSTPPAPPPYAPPADDQTLVDERPRDDFRGPGTPPDRL